ncbi:MAG TPA: DUF779 domain-containing protein [Ideonella sp.]|uniref:DUF779 domain-containing protein n=1 Tax=Ideonella sp. TaxID=1929293 RepID=UPI002BF7AA96|nr:DUF779 domain-containing protein [Ideonella sp.]HSI49369.1 DUF779 domain-containing protein [Ideonella sp.]
MIERVIDTEAALAMVARLQVQHGEGIFFYQAGGCCEGSHPMCCAPGDLTLNTGDVQLGQVGGVPFHVSRSQCEYLLGSQLTLDVLPGSQGSYSLEDPEGVHFVSLTRLWTDEEWQALAAQPVPG